MNDFTETTRMINEKYLRDADVPELIWTIQTCMQILVERLIVQPRKANDKDKMQVWRKTYAAQR